MAAMAHETPREEEQVNTLQKKSTDADGNPESAREQE